MSSPQVKLKKGLSLREESPSVLEHGERQAESAPDVYNEMYIRASSTYLSEELNGSKESGSPSNKKKLSLRLFRGFENKSPSFLRKGFSLKSVSGGSRRNLRDGNLEDKAQAKPSDDSNDDDEDEDSEFDDANGKFTAFAKMGSSRRVIKGPEQQSRSLFENIPESMSEEMLEIQKIITDHTRCEHLITELIKCEGELSVKIRFCLAAFEYEHSGNKHDKKAKGRKITAMFIREKSIFRLKDIPFE
jgi:hypothetical protein